MKHAHDRLFQKRNFGKRGSNFTLTERDNKILNFLWKWKLASTATVHEAVGRPSTPYSTYKALERLEKHKFIRIEITFQQNLASWTLTDLGFSTIRASLGDLNEEGYLSENPWHDRNVVAFQLGEWATHQLPIIQHFTEQEMRRYAVENYPTWVPHSKDHRADGYTQIKIKDRETTLAFEVEIWQKSLSSYETTMRFYQLIRKIDRIYWLIGERAVKEKILRARECIKEKSQNLHLFVEMDEYIERGWESGVTNECSENLGTLRENMQGLCGDIYGEQIGNKWGQSSVTVHYDTRKVLGKKRT